MSLLLPAERTSAAYRRSARNTAWAVLCVGLMLAASAASFAVGYDIGRREQPTVLIVPEPTTPPTTDRGSITT